MPVRFHLDEHVDPAVATALVRRGIDVTTTVQAGLLGATDERHLAYALGERRVVLTQDDDFLRLAASGVPHAEVVYCKQGTRTLGEIIEYLELMDACMSQDEMIDHVEFA
jgi:predicted nuclease of predicted toxin-antitoxin system